MTCICGHRVNCHQYATGTYRNEGRCLVNGCGCPGVDVSKLRVAGEVDTQIWENGGTTKRSPIGSAKASGGPRADLSRRSTPDA